MKKILSGLSISKTRAFITVLSLVVSMLIAQITFFVLQKSQVETTKNLVQSVLRQEINVSNSFLMARAIADLQHLGLISCTKLFSEKTSQTLLDLSYEGNCEPNLFLLSGLRSNFDLPSLNGEVWSISFVANNGPFFRFSLWTARFSAALLTFIGLLLLFRKIDIDSQLRADKEKENRYLQNTLTEKELKITEISEQVRREQSLAAHAAQVAHDIKSPLSVISMLSTQIGNDSPEEAILLQEAAKGIIRSAENLLENVRNQKNRVQNKTNDMTTTEPVPTKPVQSVPVQPVSDLDSLCKTILEMKRIECGEHKAQIRMIMHSESLSPDKRVLYDSHHLKSIVSNLINNSIEAISGEGFISLDLSIQEHSVIIEIRDSGRGIPENLLKVLGRKSITHGKSNGNGLGLLNAMNVLESWGGTLDIHSDGQRGTTVKVSLQIEQ